MDEMILNPPPQLVNELREKTARLKNLEQLNGRLQGLVSAGRKDTDFDLFFRRLQMAEIFSSLPPEAMEQLHLTDFYPEVWKLAEEAHRTTKFADEEKNISRQLLEQARRENNPVRRQYLALALISFGKFGDGQSLIDQNFWSPQLKKDLVTFLDYKKILLPPQARAMLARNDQIKAFLQEKYSALIQKHLQAVIDDKTCPRISQDDYQIYFCWFQGEENLPPIVRCCYNSLKQNAGRYKIVFIDENNLSRYVDIAPHIMDKFRAGKITRTHFSDILRVNLLERHGGLWLDATILVTDPLEKHKDLLQMPFFSGKTAKEKNNFLMVKNTYSESDIHYHRWYPFIQGTSIIHNPLFSFLKHFFESYWSEFDFLLDYFLIDFAINLAYDNIPFVRKEIDNLPINNPIHRRISSHLDDSYATYPLDEVLKDNFLQKLTWKKQLDMTRPDTVFREIQRRYAPETIQQ